MGLQPICELHTANGVRVCIIQFQKRCWL